MGWLVFGIALALALFIGWVIWIDEECPRTIMGYKCRGDQCDHSEQELSRVKNIMGRG